MKKIKTVFATMVLMSTNVFATSIIDDSDGSAGRVTYFENAPVDGLVTLSSSAYNLTIYTPRYQNNAPCQSGVVYELDSGKELALLNIDSQNTQLLTGLIPKGYEHKEKIVEALCTDLDGQTAIVRHKLPYAPKIKWQSELIANNWGSSNLDQNIEYYQNVNYSTLINIDNGEPEATCSIHKYGIGTIPKIFKERHRYGFHADVIRTSGEVEYDTRNNIFAIELSCRGAGGTVQAVEMWNISESLVEKNTQLSGITIN